MKIEIILGRIFLSIVSLIIVFLLIDYASLRFLPSRSSPIERKFNVGELRKPKPYVMFGGIPNANYSVGGLEHLNSLGYRGKEPSHDKPKDEYRIFLLGGSTVLFGDPPIAVLLEEQFKDHGHKNVSVYNFGVLSSVSGMELSRIMFEISDFNPDLIIMYNGGNDVMQPFYYDPRPGYPFNFIAYDSNPLIESDINKYPTVALLAYGSNILRYLFPSYFVEKFVPLERIREEVNIHSREWTEDIARSYVNNLVKADKISGSFGSQFVGFFQPIIFFKEPLSPREKKFVGSESNHFLYIRGLIRAEIETYKSKSQLEVFDLSDIFDGIDETVYSDKIHILQNYQAMIAKEIYKDTVKYVTLD